MQYVHLFLLVKIHFLQTEVSSFSSVVKKEAVKREIQRQADCFIASQFGLRA
jgi:hypothetical protein